MSNLNIIVKNKEKKKHIKTIHKLDEKCKNDIKISEEICKNIPFFYTYFNPIIKSEIIKLAIVDEENEIIDTNFKINNNHNHNSYNVTNKIDDVLIWKKNKSEYKEFHLFFMELKTPQDIIVYLIDSYKELLDSIKILNMHKICYFDLKMDKIVFDKFEKPVLFDFEEAIHYDDIKFLNSYIPNYYVWSLEAIVIHFLKDSDCKSISRANIESICKSYIIKNKALAFFPENYIVSYYKKCVESLLKYINMPKEDIIKKMCKHIDTWDNYSLSIIYLQLLYILRINMDIKVVDNCGFFKFFSLHLFSQINPNPEKRPNIIETYNSFNNIFIENIDWFSLSENLNREIFDGFIHSLIDNINHVSNILL